jgi:hypothetical protein
VEIINDQVSVILDLDAGAGILVRAGRKVEASEAVEQLGPIS